MKNMWKIGVVAFATLGTVACGGGSQQEAVEATEAVEAQEQSASATYTVSEGSVVNWRGFKTYSGDDHYGEISISKGELKTDGDALVGGMFTIDMNSINPKDMEPENEYRGKLIGHLMSDDFFSVETYPEATFEITGATAIENDTTGATHSISGNLDMHGISKNITFPATVMMHEGMVHLKANTFTIDRTNWEVMFNSESWLEGITDETKDKLIDHNIEIAFDIKAMEA